MDCEVTSMNHDPERSVNCQRDAIYQVVRQLDGMNGEWTNLEAFPGPNFPQISIVEQSVLVQLVFYISQRELSSPDRNIQLRKDPRQGSDVIFVSMGEHNRANTLPIFEEVRNVWDD